MLLDVAGEVERTQVRQGLAECEKNLDERRIVKRMQQNETKKMTEVRFMYKVTILMNTIQWH